MSETAFGRSDSAGITQIVRRLYQQILDGWNARSGEEFAAPFAETGFAIGYDGSQYAGRAEIAAQMDAIFANHQTPRYVANIRDVRLASADTAILIAATGLVPPGQSDINPAFNALQTIVATRNGDTWQIALFQNTPAQLFGRPELAEAMSAELRARL